MAAFPRHFSYDLTLFGSWRRKGIEDGDTVSMYDLMFEYKD